MKIFITKILVKTLRVLSGKSDAEFNATASFYYFLTRSNVKSAWLAFRERPGF